MPQLTSISGTPPATASPPLCTQHPLPARSLASSCPGLHPEASTDTLGRGTALGLQGLGRVAVAEKPAWSQPLAAWDLGPVPSLCKRGFLTCPAEPPSTRGVGLKGHCAPPAPRPTLSERGGGAGPGTKGRPVLPEGGPAGVFGTSEGAPACSQCARGGARQGPAHPPERHAHPGLAPPPQSPAQSRGSHAHPSPAPPPRACPARGLRDPRYLLGRRRSASARPSGALGAALR